MTICDTVKGRIELDSRLESASPLKSSTVINQLFLVCVGIVSAAPLLLGTGLGVTFGVVVGTYESAIYRSPKVIFRVLWRTVVWANIYAIAYGIGTATITYFLLYGFSLHPIITNYLDFGDNGVEVLFPFLILPSTFASLIGAFVGSNVGIAKSPNYLQQYRSRR